MQVDLGLKRRWAVETPPVAAGLTTFVAVEPVEAFANEIQVAYATGTAVADAKVAAPGRGHMSRLRENAEDGPASDEDDTLMEEWW